MPPALTDTDKMAPRAQRTRNMLPLQIREPVEDFVLSQLIISLDRLLYSLNYYREELQHEHLFVPETAKNFQHWLDLILDTFSTAVAVLAPGLGKKKRDRERQEALIDLAGHLQQLRQDCRIVFSLILIPDNVSSNNQIEGALKKCETLVDAVAQKVQTDIDWFPKKSPKPRTRMPASRRRM